MIKYTFLVLAFFVAAPLQAQMRDFGVAGGYEVYGKPSTRDESGGCMATYEYEGPGATKLGLFRFVHPEKSPAVFLTITNYGWSAKKEKSYNIEYDFDDVSYDREATGIESDAIYKGFSTSFPADEFLGIYAKSTYLKLLMEGSIVDHLSLKGSAAGVSLFNRCWTWLMATERRAEAERARYKDIPRDPFNKGSAPPQPDKPKE